MDRGQLCHGVGVPFRVYCQRQVLTDRYIRIPAGEVPLDRRYGKGNGLGSAVSGSDRVGAVANRAYQAGRVLCRAVPDGGLHLVPGIDAGIEQAFALFLRRRDLLDDMETTPVLQSLFYRRGPDGLIIFITKNKVL